MYAGPKNYQAADGSWTPIDTTVTKGADGRWRENANSLGVDFAGSADDPTLASVRLDGSRAVGYGLQGAGAVVPSVSGSTVTYPGIPPGTDLLLTTLATGVKESLVLHSADAATSWVFPLRLQGLTPRLESDGSVSFVDGGGTVASTIPPGSMFDSQVDPRSGEPQSSRAVTYQITTVAGGPALVLTVDRGWLADPSRVFPVTVDPTLNSSASTFAYTAISGNNSGSGLLKVGTFDGGTSKAYSFLQFSTFASTYGGAKFSAVSLNIFDIWAYTCTAKPFNVNPVTQSWTPSGVTSYPGPSFGASIGSATINPGAVCTNTSLNPNTGVWMTVGLSVGTFNGWATGTSANYGLAVTASQTDSTQWKQFDSDNTSHIPYLSVTYTPDQPPVVDSQFPPNNATVETLRPELLASGHDPDAYPAASVNYFFALYDATSGTQVGNSGWVASGDWVTPALQWAGRICGWCSPGTGIWRRSIRRCTRSPSGCRSRRSPRICRRTRAATGWTRRSATTRRRPRTQAC
ncbi:MAG TPA: DNRLRE domain-containing protein [Pseudonocardiaceae bacterium]|nr:DNRLRE domain-containing protein [Pseudonocardiaceae bacterium]